MKSIVVIRNLLTFTILVATAAWLVFSYALLPLPQISLTGEYNHFLYPWPALLSLLGIGLVQIAVVGATRRVLKSPPDAETLAAMNMFGFRLSVELFWTALPLGMTIALALAIFLFG